MNADAYEDARVHIWVKGRVQAVGFRAHVEYKSVQLGVRGWVRNVGEDTVEAVGEGVRARLDQFVEMIKQGPRGAQVDEARVEWEASTGEYTGFGVRRSI